MFTDDEINQHYTDLLRIGFTVHPVDIHETLGRESFHECAKTGTPVDLKRKRANGDVAVYRAVRIGASRSGYYRSN